MLSLKTIQDFPKVELHCHLDGSIRPQTLQKIAQKQNMPIASDILKVQQAMQAPAKCQDLNEYLTCFDYVLPYLQTKEALTMAAFDVMEQAFEDGIRYIEIRFAPILSMNKGLTVRETIEAVAQGIAQAEKQYPIIGNILVIGMRQEEIAQIKEVFQQTYSLGHDKVVGIDLAGPEEDEFVVDLADSFIFIVDEQKVSLTLHAGECGCLQNVLQAIDHGAQRIGHGTVLKGNTAVQDICRQKNICIEGCLTSNVQTNALTNYTDYPLREWLNNQVPFCMNTDNKTVSNTTLTNEYWKLAELFDLTFAEFVQLNQIAMQSAFANKETKQKVLAEMEEQINI